MASFLDIFAFASVVLRGLTLATEALVAGGIIFLLLNTPVAKQASPESLWPVVRICGVALIVVQLLSVAANSMVLMASANLSWMDVRGANFCLAGSLIISGAVTVLIFSGSRIWRWTCPPGCICILAGSVMMSHSMARLVDRPMLLILTLAHHVAGATWIGGLLYLLLTLRRTHDPVVARQVVSRFSRTATFAVPILILAGAAMSMRYVGDSRALIGTTYGAMLISKVLLTGLVILLGGLNLRIVRAARSGSPVDLLPLRRFGEVELGIGLSVILAAASLTSTPPAIDVKVERVSIDNIAERARPVWPRTETPALAELSPVTPKSRPSGLQSFVPGQKLASNSPADIAWSEYNHHWSGLVVFAAGLLALLAPHYRWARHWPLAFLALAVFLLFRADAENWPLGPRGFWESFQSAEVTQHRLFVVLIVAFGIFEWRLRTARTRSGRFTLVFPLVCAIGGTLLLTHSHSLGNVKEEFLAELSHLPLALLSIVAGWARWLEIRLPRQRGAGLSWTWASCFMLIGAILVNYREA